LEKPVDATNEALKEIEVPKRASKKHLKEIKSLVPENSDDFTLNVIEPIMRERGDSIPVSQMPLDGYVQSGTTKLEKRGVAPLFRNGILINVSNVLNVHLYVRMQRSDQN